MKAGSVILASFQQADGRRKMRPALVLCEMPKYNDSLLCGISSQLHQYVEGFDEIISEQDVDFTTSCLVKSSLIRLGFLAVQPEKEIVGIIGSISAGRHRRLLDTLSNYLQRLSKNNS